MNSGNGGGPEPKNGAYASANNRVMGVAGRWFAICSYTGLVSGTVLVRSSGRITFGTAARSTIWTASGSAHQLNSAASL